MKVDFEHNVRCTQCVMCTNSFATPRSLARSLATSQPVRQAVRQPGSKSRGSWSSEAGGVLGPKPPSAQLSCVTQKKKKVNTPFRQDGPAACLPSDTSGLVLGLSDRRAGSRTARVAQRGHGAAGSAGDQRHGVHRALLCTFRAVRRDAAHSKRLGGGNDLANRGKITPPGALAATECILRWMPLS